MFVTLLNDALDNIATVEHFYFQEAKFIINALETEAEKYRFGFEVEHYLQLMLETNLSAYDELRKKELEKSIGSYLDIPEDQPEKDKGAIIYRIINTEELVKSGVEIDIKKGMKQYIKYLEMPVIHGSNALIMLITRFEEFFSTYFQLLFELFPAKYIDKQNISFKEIGELQEIEQIKNYLMQREIEKQMRQEHTSWFKLLEDHGLKFDKLSDTLKELKEIYARRNIWVHNSGEVNSSYLSLVPDSQYKEGEHTTIRVDYITNVIRVLKTIIYAITIETARLIPKEEVTEYYHRIFTITFDLLVNKEYDITSYVYKILMNTKELPADIRLMSQVNYWISQIALTGLEKHNKEISEWDVSACDKAFQLAKELLLTNYERATVLLEFLFNNKEIGTREIKEWPLFKDYRKTTFYVDFQKKHSNDFEILSFESTEDSIPENVIIVDSDKNDEDVTLCSTSPS